MASAIATTKYVANKAISIRGKQYKPGNPVDVSNLPAHKVSQMLNQRILRPAPTKTDA